MRLNILMPVYNGADVVADTVASVLGQTSGASTLVIVDDGSQDDTPALLEGLRMSDRRVRVVSAGRNTGIIAALNLGLQHLDQDCEYVARIDCGDLCAPSRFERQSGYMDTHRDCVLVGSRFAMFAAGDALSDGIRRFEQFTNPLCGHEEIAANFTVMSPLHHPTWFCRRRLFEEVGGYDARFQAAEDYELLGRVLTRGLRVAKLPEALVRCRFAPGRGISQTRRVEQVRTGLRVKLDYVLANYLTDGIARRCVIWGSREFAGYLAELLADDRYRLSPACLTDFDEQRWGMKIAGLTVVSPDDALGGRQAEDVVITVWNRERERILAFLDSRGCRRNRDYFIFS